jgi:hypothetical protein
MLNVRRWSDLDELLMDYEKPIFKEKVRICLKPVRVCVLGRGEGREGGRGGEKEREEAEEGRRESSRLCACMHAMVRA